ncbi:MAG: hypothetical protein HXY28_02820 [Hydrogenophilaceae bacterium]|nr:hypothetical protein [Hydrogenophilaceae bacterium]
MKKFLAIYLVSAERRAAWDAMDPAVRKAREADGMKAWLAWQEAQGRALVDGGGPLGRTKSVGPEGVRDVRNAMAGYVILEAESHEAAARLFENHPHFTIFPGERVEIMECLPVLTM